MDESISTNHNIKIQIEQYGTRLLSHIIFQFIDETSQEYMYEILSNLVQHYSDSDGSDDPNDEEILSTQELVSSILVQHIDDGTTIPSILTDPDTPIEEQIQHDVTKLIRSLLEEHRIRITKSSTCSNTKVPTPRNGPNPVPKVLSSNDYNNIEPDNNNYALTTKFDTLELNSGEDDKNEESTTTTIKSTTPGAAKSKRKELRQHRKINNTTTGTYKKSQQPHKNIEEKEEDGITTTKSTTAEIEISTTTQRGTRKVNYNSIQGNIHLQKVSLLMKNGNQLLNDTTIDIVRGHRYGLIGRNGCGKSTLLQQLAAHNIPGLPSDLRILFVQQQVVGSPTQTTLQALIAADTDRTSLLHEQQSIEQQLESFDSGGTLSTLNPEQIASLSERLNEIIIELDTIDADTIEERATAILKGLQFTKTMIANPTQSLSGGWRMRLAIAQALLLMNRCDLLLLDECTNHLDLYGLEWLIGYLTTPPLPGGTNNQNEQTMILVSHDRIFLDSVCTDIIVMAHQRLSYHVGNYSDYEQQMEEKHARENQIVDAAERQRQKAETFIKKASVNNKHTDPNKQRQAKMIKEKKLDRIGNYRDDGKRYKMYSLKKLDESYIRLAQKVTVEADERIITMHFPNPSWPNSLSKSDDTIVRFQNVTFAYAASNSNDSTNDKPNKDVLNNVTLNLNRNSKVAVVGKNGTGKSTVCKLITGELTTTKDQQHHHHHLEGEVWVHPNIRVGHITQYSVEELEQNYGTSTVLEYAELVGMRTSKASADIIAKGGSGNIRQYLGSFGLGDTRHVTSLIKHLSGGERMRLCFATTMATQPHLLLLDESTNHVDIETLESMSLALQKFEGCIVMVSHNQAFLSGFCDELWIVNDQGSIQVHHATETESFDDLFTNYRRSLHNRNNDTDGTLSSKQREKARLAKKATRHDAKNRTVALL